MDHVVLELRPDPGPSDIQRDTGSIPLVIEAWSLTEEDWAALSDGIGHRLVDIVTKRDALATKSTYFRALFSDFREAGLDRINVNWDTTSFLYLMQFIFCGMSSISSSRAANLLEAATFFGTDTAILAVEEWASSAWLSRDPEVINDVLQSLPYIWNTSNILGHQALSQFCPQFLAVNFGIVMALSSFVDLPSALLSASIAHPQLTVHSERQLCDALLRWYEKQTQDSDSGELTRDEPTSMLSQVRKSLLPKDYLLRRLLKNCPLDASSTVIRITEYLDYLDLSGCCEVTDVTLFTSSAHASIGDSQNYKAKGHASIPGPSCSTSRIGNQTFFSSVSSFYNAPARKPNWPKIPFFENLKRLNLSQCWRIPQDSLVMWLGEACPNLLELILINCPQITISILQALATVCPLLELADFSLEVTYVSSKEFKVYSTEGNSSWVHGDASGLWRCSFSELTKLSLQGHTEISDLELIALAICSRGLLDVDLSMCTTLTDGGMSRFLKAYPSGLKALKAKRTAFGSLSCTALTCALFSNQIKEPSEEALSSTSRRECLLLTTLDLESCRGANEEDLSSVLRNHSALTHLSLGETNLTDVALLSFCGTSLQQLHLRETQKIQKLLHKEDREVSGQALACIIRSNPGLTVLDIQGCKRACIDNYDLLVTEADSDTKTTNEIVPLIFKELGKQQMLEDLRVGWRFGDFAQLTIQPASPALKNVSLGIGGTITDVGVQNLSECCKSLKQLTLSFQVISEVGLIGFLDKSSCLRVLELQYCLMHVSSLGISALAAGCGSRLSVLKLERVAPGIVDRDIRILSEGCSQLAHLSLVGCKALSAESLRTIATNWSGLTQLKLEDCKGLTSRGADCLLQSCVALEMLTLRHNGKGLTKGFIMDAMMQFPLLRHLSLDMCDSVANGFETPNQVKGVLNTLFIARCKLPRHAFQLGLTSASDSSNQSQDLCHKETIVKQWNVDESKVYIVKDRL